MPYTKDGKKYDRITEVVSGLECEAIAYINETEPINRAQKSNTSSLQGTLAHNKIAKNELGLLSKPYKRLLLELDTKDRHLLNKLVKNHRSQKKIESLKDYNRSHTPTKYERMNAFIEAAYMNYISFLADYPHEVILVEEKRWWDKRRIAGTIDLIMKTSMNGYLKTMTLHPELGPKEYFIPDHKHPDAVPHQVVTLLDWKTSKLKQEGHRVQLSGYHFMWEELGELDRFRKKGWKINSESWSVLLGERTYPKSSRAQQDWRPYQLLKYSVESSDFLLALRIRENPRPLTVNAKSGKDGLKPRCMVCSDIMYCPDNALTPSVPDWETFIPLEPFSLGELALMTSRGGTAKSRVGQLVNKKINRMFNTLQKEIEDNGNEEIMKLSEQMQNVNLFPTLVEDTEE
jgi:hypothetical protein